MSHELGIRTLLFAASDTGARPSESSCILELLELKKKPVVGCVGKEWLASGVWLKLNCCIYNKFLRVRYTDFERGRGEIPIPRCPEVGQGGRRAPWSQIR